MNIGAMMGGAFQGGMKVWDQFQQEDRLKLDQERMAMEREKADREKTAFGEAQALKTSLKDISTQEDAARQDYALSSQYSAGTPNAAGNVVDDSIAIGTANINADESLTDAEKATKIQDMTQGIKKAWEPKYGLVPDSVNAYRFGLERANALQTAGAFKEARELKANIQDDAAGAGMSALLNKDHRTFNALKSIYDRAGTLAEVRGFDAKGNLIIGSDSTQKPIVVDKFDALAGVAATASSPEKTLATLTSRYNREDMDELRRLLGLRAADTADAKVMAGSGARLTGSGAGSAGGSGSGKAEGVLYDQGFKTQDDWDKFVNNEVNKDNPPMLTGTGGKSIPVDLAKYRSDFSTAAHGIVTSNPGMGIRNAAPLAHRLARAQLIPDPGVQVSPVFDKTNGVMTVGAKIDGKEINLGNQELSEPEVTNMFMRQVQNPSDKAQVAAAQSKANEFLVNARATQTDYIAGKFNVLEDGKRIVEKGVSYDRNQFIRTFFGGDADKYNAARDLAAARMNEARRAQLDLHPALGNEGRRGAAPAVKPPTPVEGAGLFPQNWSFSDRQRAMTTVFKQLNTDVELNRLLKSQELAVRAGNRVAANDFTRKYADLKNKKTAEFVSAYVQGASK